MRRSRGALSGMLLILLGLWGALIPFIGPYFHYAYTPDSAWTYSSGRLWLEILPGAAAFLGGALLLIARGRHIALSGALLAAAGGAWFAVGTAVSPLWSTTVQAGTPVGTTTLTRTMEQIGFFTGLGLVIVFVAAAAAGRVVAVPSGLRTVTAPEAETIPVAVGRHTAPTRPQARAAENQPRAAENQPRAAEKQPRAAEKQARAAEKQARATEKQARATEKDAPAAENQPRAEETTAKETEHIS